MYAAHFNLEELPFEEGFDPKFIWLGKKHLNELLKFKSIILERRGAYVLTGDAGTGKTFLVKRFLTEIGPNPVVAAVPYPDLDIYSFFSHISEAFQLDGQAGDRGLFWLHVRRFLLDAYEKNLRVILVIDEAQRIHPDLHKEIMLLSSIKSEKTNLLDVVFVGQPAFRSMMFQKTTGEFYTKIASMYHLEPLSEDETKALILHRLKAAGAKSPVFSPQALHEIYHFSRGYPRLVITICDRAMLSAFVKNIHLVDKDIIIETSQELRIKSKAGNEKDLQALEGPLRFPDFRAKSPNGNEHEADPAAKRNAASAKTSGLRKSLLITLLIAIVIAFAVFKAGFLPGLKNDPLQIEEPLPASPNHQIENLAPALKDNDEHGRPVSADDFQTKRIQADDPAEGPAENEYRAAIVSNQVVGASQEPDWVSADETKEKREPGSDDSIAVSKKSPLQKEPTSEKAGAPKTESRQTETLLGNKVADAGLLSANLQTAASPAFPPAKGPGPKLPDPSPVLGDGPTSRAGITGVEATSANGKDPGPANFSKGRASPEVQQPAAGEINRRSYVSAPELESFAVQAVIALPDVARLEPEIEDKRIESRTAKEQRLRSFLDAYCRTYAARDIEQFITFFTPDAEENGKTLSSLLAEYRRAFKENEAVSYKIELQDYAADSGQKIVRIEGNFSFQQLSRGSDWQKSSGKISMQLKENDRSYLIYRMDHSAD